MAEVYRQTQAKQGTVHNPPLSNTELIDCINRPEELIVPYDPAFIPDFTFPDLDLDILNSLGSTATAVKLDSSLVSSNLSSSSHIQLDIDEIPQLDINSSPTTIADFRGLSFPSGSAHSTRAYNTFLRETEIRDEEGVLLQPDFDIDEEGNIVDLVMGDALATQVSQTPVRKRISHEIAAETLQSLQVNFIPSQDLAHHDLIDF